jgi:short-subunit dehydrogenase
MTPEFKTALITGASSGLGRGLAAYFAKKGLTVYAAARRADRLESLAVEAGNNIKPLQLDVADADATHARITALDTECGGLDLVIANAGVSGPTQGKRMNWATAKQIIDVNIAGAAATLCAPLPGMVSRGKGHLVAISSLASYVQVPKYSMYGASKAFLSSFAEGLRLDVEQLGITVTTIEPGFVKSEMTDKNSFKMPFILETADAVERMAKAILANERQLTFPWQLSALVQSAAAMPKAIQRLAARGLP